MQPIEHKKQPYLIDSIKSSFMAQILEMATFGHIFDRIKVQQQSNPNLPSIRATVQQMQKMGGIKEFYKGMEWSLLSAAKGTSKWGGYTGFYQLYEKIFPVKMQEQYPSLVSASVGVSSALVNTTFVHCPLDNLKTRKMTAQSSSETLKRALQNEGISFFFKGWKQTLMKQSLSASTHLTIFEKCKQEMQKYNNGVPATLAQKILVTSATASLSCLLLTPFDMMKTQAQKTNPLSEKKILKAAKLLYKQYGFSGFYSSLNVKIIRASWQMGVTMTAMDYCGTLPKQMQF